MRGPAQDASTFTARGGAGRGGAGRPPTRRTPGPCLSPAPDPNPPVEDAPPRQARGSLTLFFSGRLRRTASWAAPEEEGDGDRAGEAVRCGVDSGPPPTAPPRPRPSSSRSSSPVFRFFSGSTKPTPPGLDHAQAHRRYLQRHRPHQPAQHRRLEPVSSRLSTAWSPRSGPLVPKWQTEQRVFVFALGGSAERGGGRSAKSILAKGAAVVAPRKRCIPAPLPPRPAVLAPCFHPPPNTPQQQAAGAGPRPSRAPPTSV